MKASAAVGLLLASSMSIFGVYGRQSHNPNIPPGPEPVWVNGQMGVYHPLTGEFIPGNSPRFDETCDLIRQRRQAAIDQNAGSTTRPSSGNPNYYHGSSSYGNYYGLSYGGASAASDAYSGSTRGGIGGTGHAMGAASS